MSDMNVYFATRDPREPRKYRDYNRGKVAAQPSGADDLEAQAAQNSPFEDAAQDRVAFPTGTGMRQSFQVDGKFSVYQRKQKAILDNLKVKTVGLDDSEADDGDDCNWHPLFPRAGFTKKAAAAAANWEDTEDSTSSADSNESYGREASSSDRNAGVYSKNDCSSARPTRGELGVCTRSLLQGGEGMYRPPMRGSGEVCPPKEDCEEETQRSRVGRSSCIGRKNNTRPINVSGALASGGDTRANNRYGASTGGQRGCERPSSPVDDEEIVVRFSSVRSTRMKKKVDLRGISGSGASASGGGSLESGNCDSSSENDSSGSGALTSGSSGGLPDRRDGTGSSAVYLPRNADAGSTDCFSSGAAGRLPGAVNRPTLRGSGGFYKPPMRGLGEVCPPKKESNEMIQSSDAGSTDGSSSGAAGRFPGAVNRPTLRGSGGFYKPHIRGLGEVCPPKEESKEMIQSADAGSTDGSSSGAAGRLPRAVNRPTLRGSGGFYKPPMRGLGEVCPPKKESK